MIGESLAERSQWRWIFWLNLPFCVVAFLILPFFAQLKSSTPGAILPKLRNIDWLGFLLLSGSLVSVLLGLSWVSIIPTNSSFLNSQSLGTIWIFIELRKQGSVPWLRRICGKIDFDPRRIRTNGMTGRYTARLVQLQHIITATIRYHRTHIVLRMVVVFTISVYDQSRRISRSHKPGYLLRYLHPRHDHLRFSIFHGTSIS